MIHAYNDDEIVSTTPAQKHAKDCQNQNWEQCNCTPVFGQRIVIEKWDDYVIEVKEKAK